MPIVLTPNMSLPVPVVGQEAGPQYATDINGCMSILDAHDHTPGSGVFITPNAININTDLSFGSNRATGVKSVVFDAQISPLPASAPDLGAVYVAGVDLYYNDENGNQVRITQNGGVVSGSGGITGLVPPASASYVSADSTFVWQSNINTPASMDFASAIFRNLVANSFGLTLNPPNAMGADYSLVLPQLPVTNPRVLTIDTSGNISPSAIPGTGTEESDVLPGFGLMPSGAITAYGGTSAPAGYLLCNGASLLRASYANLFTAIGTAYGAADGTHFNVPDLRGYFARGTDNGAGNDPDASGRIAANPGGNTGDNVGSQQSYQIQSHGHNFATAVVTNAGGVSPSNLTIGSPPTTATYTDGTAVNMTGGAETRPKNVYVNYIIKT